MIQAGEGSLLGGEALSPRGREPGISQDLDRGVAPEVCALGQKDHTHPAFADHAKNSVRSDLT